MKAITITMLTLMFTLFAADVPVADAHAGFIRRGIERRQARRSDRQARKSDRQHSRSMQNSHSMHSAPATTTCPTCGKSGIQAVPVPPTTDAPGVSLRVIRKERILNASI